MTANEGMHLLLDLERRVGRGAVGPDTLICVVARAGGPDCVVRAGRISEMIPLDFGPPLHSLAVPGKLHFMESEALEALGEARLPKNGLREEAR
jgi:diphthine synthase